MKSNLTIYLIHFASFYPDFERLFYAVVFKFYVKGTE